MIIDFLYAFKAKFPSADNPIKDEPICNLPCIFYSFYEWPGLKVVVAENRSNSLIEKCSKHIQIR